MRITDNTFSTVREAQNSLNAQALAFVSVAGEAASAGELDYLWLRLFARQNAGAIKEREVETRFRRKKRYVPSIFPTVLAFDRALDLIRKLNVCVLATKDEKYIRKMKTEKYWVKIRRCERYSETKRLSKYWKRYLEDVKLNFTAEALGSNKDYSLDFHCLRLYNG